MKLTREEKVAIKRDFLVEVSCGVKKITWYKSVGRNKKAEKHREQGFEAFRLEMRKWLGYRFERIWEEV